MKNILFYTLILLSVTSISQINPIDFEPGGIGSDWTFTVFENVDNPPLEIVANPDPSGLNTSTTVAKFTARIEGAPFVGCETMHGSDVGTFTLSSENAFVAIMVYKSVISDVGFKYATPEGASTGEKKVSNTQVNQWERLVFDFTDVIDEPSSTGIDQIIIFPDFQERTTENIIYFDTIVFGDESLLNVSENELVDTVIYPNPASSAITIASSDPLVTVTVLSIQGQLVQYYKLNTSSAIIDTSNLSTGYYFVKIATENSEQVKKLMIN